MIIHTNSRSRKRRNKSKKLTQAKVEHEKFLKSMRVSKDREFVCIQEFPDLSVKSNIPPTSDHIPTNAFKKSVDDYKWKSDRKESAEAIAEAEAKKSRVAPAYNKGPVMYVTEASDPKSLGRKV